MKKKPQNVGINPLHLTNPDKSLSPLFMIRHEGEHVKGCLWYLRQEIITRF